MAYTTIDNPELYFQTKLYTANDSGQAITFDGSENMQPDWVWIKSRTDTNSHNSWDSVRGVNKYLENDTTKIETTVSNGVTSFDSNGFTVGNRDAINDGSLSFVSWNWKAGGSASSNSDGTITTSVSANTTAGFSIVSYSGTNNNQTVGHGLGAAPKMIILKNRSRTNNWCVGHGSLGFTKHLALNEADAVGTSSVRFQDTAPTSTVYSVGAAGETNGSGNNIIAYCFAEKQGYSKFGSYTGNGNTDGSFVYTGFLPAFVMIKRSSSTGNWYIADNKRDTFNVVSKALFPNASSAEGDLASNTPLDFTSNGFKLRNSNLTGDTNINISGSTYIYMAFADAPLVNSKGVPNNAR